MLYTSVSERSVRSDRVISVRGWIATYRGDRRVSQVRGYRRQTVSAHEAQIAKTQALVAVSAMIGAVMMSRIVTDPELSAAILHHTKKHLLNL
jgi:hypothetical protein